MTNPELPWKRRLPPREWKNKGPAYFLCNLEIGEEFETGWDDFEFRLIRHGRTAPISLNIFNGIRHEFLTLEITFKGQPLINGLSCCDISVDKRYVSGLFNEQGKDIDRYYWGIGTFLDTRELNLSEIHWVFATEFLHWTDPIAQVYSVANNARFHELSVYRQLFPVLLNIAVGEIVYEDRSHLSVEKVARLEREMANGKRYSVEHGYAVQENGRLVLTQKGRDYMEHKPQLIL